MSKIEKAQARIVKLQAESDCVNALVKSPNVTKEALASVWLDSGTCLNHVKKLAKKGN